MNLAHLADNLRAAEAGPLPGGVCGNETPVGDRQGPPHIVASAAAECGHQAIAPMTGQRCVISGSSVGSTSLELL
jgi:hypothetical protein